MESQQVVSQTALSSLLIHHTAYGVESPHNEQGLTVATQRCKSWGYEKAVAFEFETSTCLQQSDWGCVKTLVTKEYQCE